MVKNVNEINFTDFKDFYVKRYYIKECFDTLSIGDKYLYKEIVYAKKCDIFEYKLDKIWEFLNEPWDSDFFVEDDLLRKFL